MTTDDRIDALKAYRLEHDLSFTRLAEVMSEHGFEVSMRTLHAALTGRMRTLPRETTLYKFGQFVVRARERAELRARRSKAQKKRPRRAAA